MKKIYKNCKHYKPPKAKYEKIDMRMGDKLEYWDCKDYSAGFFVGQNFSYIYFKKK